MGWFSYQDTEQVIGDDVLDLTYSYLEQLSKKYCVGLDRKINLEELQTLLCMSLDVSGEDFIEGLCEKSVSKVTVKTAKRRKKQTYKVGDIFAAPVSSGGYVFGRIVHIVGLDEHIICEVFRYHSNKKLFSSEIVHSGRLIPPFVELPDIFTDWEWKIIGHNEDGMEKNPSTFKFVVGYEGYYFLVPGDKADQFCKENPISDEEAAKLQHIAFKTAGGYAEDFADALAK